MEDLLISPQEVKNRLRSAEKGYILVDIRDEDEYNDWNISGSMNIPVNTPIAKGNYSVIREYAERPPER